MRISDWSSDVCSADLLSPTSFATVRFKSSGDRPYGRGDSAVFHSQGCVSRHLPAASPDVRVSCCERISEWCAWCGQNWPRLRASSHTHLNRPERMARLRRRSEEHTSELQSLMRISYAVFCLKKKKIQQETMYINI